MPTISIHVEDCPKCGSDDVYVFNSHYCKAFIVICRKCRHEAGRENTERQAISVWNEEAEKANADKAETLSDE